MNKELTLKEWYLKVVKFKRTRWVAEDIFRRQAIKSSELASRIEGKLTKRTSKSYWSRTPI